MGRCRLRQIASAVDQPGDTRFDLGMVLDLGEHHHLLASAGHAFDRQAAQAYVAWLMTFGPLE